MKAKALVDSRIVYSEGEFAESVLWLLPTPLSGSTHRYKYHLAYVVGGECMIRYDNEAGKGDHRHVGNRESTYSFVDVDKLLADFQRDIRRVQNENRDS